MYKCCWNCDNGYPVADRSRETMERYAATKRACCAPASVFNHLLNPFQQRYCKQFEPGFRPKKGHFIDKREAEKLNKMTTDELVQYWRERRDGE